MRRPGAALLEIGDELLSGKVEDTNGPFLIRELRQSGVQLCELRVVQDRLDAIAAAVRELSEAYETVFTSGGVGPTHDDVTLAGIARAFDEPLVENQELAASIRRFYKERTNPHLLRMARLPQSAELLMADRMSFPCIRVRNVYVMPGEPTIFRAKWRFLRAHFRDEPFHLRRVYTRLDEGVLAGWLEAIAAEHGVDVGSYPRYDSRAYRVMVTIEGRDAPQVEAAHAALLGRIPAEELVEEP